MRVDRWHEPIVLAGELSVEADVLVFLEHPVEVRQSVSPRVVLVLVELRKVLPLGCLVNEHVVSRGRRVLDGLPENQFLAVVIRPAVEPRQMVDCAARGGIASVLLVEAAPLALADALLVLGRTAAPIVPDLPAVALVTQ